MALPLKGIKVLEMAGLAPAPFCGMILKDFGASVIRIDKVGSVPDVDCLGNGKESLALNLKHSHGINILKQLCRNVDVIIEPFRKGVMESLGIGPDVLLDVNSQLIYARLTGYGQFGPYCQRAGHDINYLGLSGLMSLFGRFGDKPVFPVNLAADFGGGGLICALGIVLALYERKSSGVGQVIDSSMVEGTAYLGSWLYRSQNLPFWGKSRGKNFLDSGAHFYDVYETKDGNYMSVGAIEPKFYEQLLKGLQLSSEDVLQFYNFEENKKIFTAKFLEKTRAEWCEIFENTDACVTPVLSLEEAPTNKHNFERNSFSHCNDTFIPRPAPKLSRTSAESSGKLIPPHKGQHTEEILKMLKYDPEEIVKLEADGVIETYRNSKL